MSKGELSTNEDPTSSGRIGVKTAVQRARGFLLDLYEGEDLPNLRLEEVELSEDGDHWLITLGFTGSEKEFERGMFSSPMGGTTTRSRREYKLIRIDAYSGEPESMKIREL